MSRIFVRFLAAGGTLLFAALLLLTFWRPDALERLLSERIRARIVERTAQRIEALLVQASETRLGRLAQATLGERSARFEPLKKALAERAGQMLGTVMTRMQNADCECREAAAGWLHDQFGLDAGLSTAAIAGMERFLYAQYHEAAQRVLLELRIVASTHLIAFGLLWLASRGRRPDTDHRLLAPALALLAATIIGLLWLLKRQSWLQTLAFDDWLGWTYPLLCLLIFVPLRAALARWFPAPRA